MYNSRIMSRGLLCARAYSTITAATGTTASMTNEYSTNKLVATNNCTNEKSKHKMSGWQIHCYGDVDELQHADNLKIPQIRSANECLVRVHATSVNPIDAAMLKGYGAKLLNVMRCLPPTNAIEFPITLGREFCGELVQRGMGVNSTKLKLGDRVWGVVPLQHNGAHAEYVVVPDYCLSQAPTELSNEEAAAILYAGLTAWSGIYITGQLGGLCGAATASGGGANKRILVLGAAGGVGSIAVQILKSQGAEVLATCSEDAVELVTSLGADAVIDYTNPVQVEKLRNYAPYDIILDCAGQGVQKADTLNLGFRQYITFTSPMLRNIDNAGMGIGIVQNLNSLIETNVKAFGNYGGLVKWGFFVPAPQGIEFLKRLVERKKLLPNIDSTFKFEQLPDAFKKVQNGHLRGKVVVTID